MGEQSPVRIVVAVRCGFAQSLTMAYHDCNFEFLRSAPTTILRCKGILPRTSQIEEDVNANMLLLRRKCTPLLINYNACDFKILLQVLPKAVETTAARRRIGVQAESRESFLCVRSRCRHPANVPPPQEDFATHRK